RAFEHLQRWTRRWLTKPRLKAVLIGGMAVLGAWELSELVRLLLAARDPLQFRMMVTAWTELGAIASTSSIFWFAGRVAIEGSEGLLLVLSSWLLVFGRDRAGTALAILTLVFALTAVNLVAFYVDQFSTILNALIQFILLVSALLLQNQLDLEEYAASASD
ncbi:MAG: hypothetical protein PVI04_09460, partial [Anaerolineales bacterium]